MLHRPLPCENLMARVAAMARRAEPSSSVDVAAAARVAVGMPVPRHPPHRSRRAARPHRALALGRNAPALRRIRMPKVGGWKPRGGEWIPPLPGQALALTAPSYDATPVAESTVPANPEPAPVARDSRGPIVPDDNPCEPGPERRDGPGHTLAPSLRDLLALLAEPCGAGTAPPRHLASGGWATHGRQAEEGDGLRLPLSTPLAPCACPTPTLHAARLRRGQCTVAPGASLPQVAAQLLGGVFVLEADHAIVTVPHDKDIAPCVPAAPLRGPEVKDIGQGQVRQERTCAAPLGPPCRRLSPVPILQPARLAPLTAGTDDALVPNPGRDTLPHPCVVKRLVQAPHVGIESPGAGALCTPHRDRLQRVVRAAAWAGTVRKPEELWLVDGVAHRDRRPLDAGVCQPRLADGPLAPLSFGAGDPLDRGSVGRSPLAPVCHVPQRGVEPLAVGGPWLALQARGCLVLEAVRRLPPSVAGGDMLPQRGHPLPALLGCLPDPVQRL